MFLTTAEHVLVVLIITPAVAAFDWILSAGNAYTAFTVDMVVPPVPQRPPGAGSYFYWPGLQSTKNAHNYYPIGFAVLQPVLTFGPACTPNQPPGADPYRGWHISPQFVVSTNNSAAPYNCLGGNMMDVAPGETLSMSMVLQGVNWVQTVTRVGVPCSGPGSGTQSAQGCQVSYSANLSEGSKDGQPQAQSRAELDIELYGQAIPTDPITFNNIVLVTIQAEPAGSVRFCTSQSPLKIDQKYGVVETCNGMTLSPDQKTCTIQQCVFNPPLAPVTVPPAPTNIDPGSVFLPPPPVDNVNIDPNSVLPNGALDTTAIADTASSLPESVTSNGNSTSGEDPSNSNAAALASSTIKHNNSGSKPNNAPAGNTNPNTDSIVYNNKLIFYGSVGGGILFLIIVVVGVAMYRASKAKTRKNKIHNEAAAAREVDEKFSRDDTESPLPQPYQIPQLSYPAVESVSQAYNHSSNGHEVHGYEYGNNLAVPVALAEYTPQRQRSGNGRRESVESQRDLYSHSENVWSDITRSGSGRGRNYVGGGSGNTVGHSKNGHGVNSGNSRHEYEDVDDMRDLSGRSRLKPGDSGGGGSGNGRARPRRGSSSNGRKPHAGEEIYGHDRREHSTSRTGRDRSVTRA